MSKFDPDDRSFRAPLVLLTEGYASPLTAKTAVSLLRYRADDVLAVFDRGEAGRTAGDLLGFGGDTPVIGDLKAAEGAGSIVIGIAPPGGRVPEEWKPILLEAIERGMDIVSGLHDFLINDPALVEAATKQGTRLVDVRRNNERDVATTEGISEDCLRLLTISHDCSVGKMLAAVEVTQALKAADVNAKLIATGQTGILVEGDGCPIDCVVSDFVNGAVEKQIKLQQDKHDVLVVEGQASIAHPRYSAVSAGLLHGAAPHGMIAVYEVGREALYGMEPLPLTPLPRLIQAYEDLAALRMPALRIKPRVIAVAMNSRRVSLEEAHAERERMQVQLGLPVADPLRHGCDSIVRAIEKLRQELIGGP